MSQPLTRSARARHLARQALEDLDRAPMRKFDVNPVAIDALSEGGLIEAYQTDVGAHWVRISDAGRLALETIRGS